MNLRLKKMKSKINLEIGKEEKRVGAGVKEGLWLGE